MTRETAGRVRFWAIATPLVGGTLLLGAISWPPVGGEAPPRRHVVEVRGFEYHPETLTIAAGDTVVWVNRDIVPHTATAAGGGWDSGAIESGGVRGRVFSGAGTAPYTCTYHPGMRGRIVIR